MKLAIAIAAFALFALPAILHTAEQFNHIASALGH